MRIRCKVYSQNFDVDLLIPTPIEVCLGLWLTQLWSIAIVSQKEKQLACENCKKFKVQIWRPLTWKSIEVLLRSWSTYVWSMIVVCHKEMVLLCRNGKKSEVLLWPWPMTFWPKIKRGPSSTHVLNILIVCQKEMELSCVNSKTFEVQIWPWPSDPKINRGPPRVPVNTCVKYHHCLPQENRVIVQKKKLFHRQTDSHGDTSIPPPLRLGDIKSEPFHLGYTTDYH